MHVFTILGVLTGTSVIGRAQRAFDRLCCSLVSFGHTCSLGINACVKFVLIFTIFKKKTNTETKLPCIEIVAFWAFVGFS